MERVYSVEKWHLNNDNSNYCAADPNFRLQIERIRNKNSESDTVWILRKIGDCNHNIHISFNFKAKFDNERFQKLDNDFETGTFLFKDFKDDSMKERTMNKINNGVLYSADEWSSVDMDYEGWFLEDSDKTYTKHLPYNLIYNDISYTNDNGILCGDVGIAINQDQYEIKVVVHSEHVYGHSQNDKSFWGNDYKNKAPKKWWWFDYFFVSMKNTKTGETKYYSFYDESDRETTMTDLWTYGYRAWAHMR